MCRGNAQVVGHCQKEAPPKAEQRDPYFKNALITNLSFLCIVFL